MRIRFIFLGILHLFLTWNPLTSTLRADEARIGVESLAILDEFNICKRGDLILVPVTIGDKSYPFVLATHIEHTIVDVKLRSLLGNSLGEKSDDGAVLGRWEEFAPVPMKIGKISIVTAGPLQCAEIATVVAEHTGHEVFGAIGTDLLRDRVVQVDFDAGKLCIRAGGPMIEPPSGAWCHPMLAQPYGYPTIILNAAGERKSFYVIDTSFTGAVTLRWFRMRQLIRKGTLTGLRQDNFVTFAGTPQVQRIGRLEGLGLEGHAPVINMKVMESSYDSVGLIYLSRFRLMFDFKNQELFMVQGARFEEPDADDWSDMILVSRNGRVTVKMTVMKGAAQLAGIRAGDTVIAVNGEQTEALTLFEIRQRLTKRAPVSITLRRGEVTLPVQMEPPPAVAIPAAP